MNTTRQRWIAAVIGIFLISSPFVQAKSHGPLTEDAALNVLLETLKRDHVYDKRISLDCVTFDTEETTRIYFEIAVRENHNAKCGGDPDLSPVIDRYKVNRASGKIELYDAPNDKWNPYSPARTK